MQKIFISLWLNNIASWQMMPIRYEFNVCQSNYIALDTEYGLRELVRQLQQQPQQVQQEQQQQQQ